MITKQIHFKNYDLARKLVPGIKAENYDVYSHLTISSQKGLILTYTLKKENEQLYLESIEALELETY